MGNAAQVIDQPPSGAIAGEGRAWLRTAVKIAISIGLMVWILSGADLDAVWTALRGASAEWIVLAVAMQFLGGMVIAVRWAGLLSVRDVAPGLPYLYRSVLVAGFVRQFLPSIVGGDAIRGYDAWRAGAKPGFAAVSLVVERMLGLVALAIFVLIAAVSSDELAHRVPGAPVWVGVGLAVLMAFLGFLVLGGGRPMKALRRLLNRAPAGLRRKIEGVADAFSAYRRRPGAILRAFILSVILQINVVSFFWALGQSLGLGLSYGDFYALVPLAIFVMMAPVTINGVGLREAVFVFLLAAWGVDQSTALAFAWLEFGVILAMGLVGGVVYMARRG